MNDNPLFYSIGVVLLCTYSSFAGTTPPVIITFMLLSKKVLGLNYDFKIDRQLFHNCFVIIKFTSNA